MSFLESILAIFGIKVTCVFASILGGLFNYSTKKLKGKQGNSGRHINWMVQKQRARKELGLSILIALVSTMFFIPPLIHQFDLHVSLSPALAFIIGYSGMRLLPAIEQRFNEILKKVLK